MNYNVENFEVGSQNQLYFTSDLHFFHKKIVEFTGRPTTFENLSPWIIQQCNSVIPNKHSTVIHLGDMFFSCTNEEAVDVLEQLNGDWWFVLGNHDNPGKLETVINTVNTNKGTNHRLLGWYHRILVKSPPAIVNQKWHRKLLILCHFPVEEWEGMDRGSYMIHGHLHGGGSEHGEHPVRQINNRFDVGIDNSHTFIPFTYESVINCIRKGSVK